MVIVTVEKDKVFLVKTALPQGAKDGNWSGEMGIVSLPVS